MVAAGTTYSMGDDSRRSWLADDVDLASARR
jgi:hypothetical protein